MNAKIIDAIIADTKNASSEFCTGSDSVDPCTGVIAVVVTVF